MTTRIYKRKSPKLTKLHKKRISDGCKRNGVGKWMNGRTGELNPFYGKKHKIETRILISKQQGGSGEFTYTDKRKIKKSYEYQLWRKSVFERDSHACVWCGSTENIEADHIKSFASFPELRFEIDNGRTLCHDCHTKTDNYGHPKKIWI